MKSYSLMVVYPSGTTIEHDLDTWDVLMAAADNAARGVTGAKPFDEIWLCEDEPSAVVGCSLKADRILVWGRS